MPCKSMCLHGHEVEDVHVVLDDHQVDCGVQNYGRKY